MTTTFTPLSVANKFQRTYLAQIQAIDGSIQSFGSSDGSSPLLTMEFMVKRDIMASAQTGTFRIRNINKSTRNVIFKDWFDQGRWPSVKIQAGYVGTPLSTIFNGIGQTIYSYREEGGTDFITEIEGHDYSLVMANSFSQWTIGSQANPVTQKQVISRLVNDLQLTAQKYNQTLGIGTINGFSANRYSYTANDFTWNILQQETNRLAYIDNGKIYAVPNNFVFQGDVTLISSQTGLLGTPRQQQTYLIVEMLFEPGLIPGQQVYLDTEDSNFTSVKQGTYKVTAVQHSGIISSALNGKCKTIATLQLVGTPLLVPFGLFTDTQ
jgi:hypothetical protein